MPALEEPKDIACTICGQPIEDPLSTTLCEDCDAVRVKRAAERAKHEGETGELALEQVYECKGCEDQAEVGQAFKAPLCTECGDVMVPITGAYVRKERTGRQA